jgi:hypothetical protein
MLVIAMGIIFAVLILCFLPLLLDFVLIIIFLAVGGVLLWLSLDLISATFSILASLGFSEAHAFYAALGLALCIALRFLIPPTIYKTKRAIMLMRLLGGMRGYSKNMSIRSLPTITQNQHRLKDQAIQHMATANNVIGRFNDRKGYVREIADKQKMATLMCRLSQSISGRILHYIENHQVKMETNPERIIIFGNSGEEYCRIECERREKNHSTRNLRPRFKIPNIVFREGGNQYSSKAISIRRVPKQVQKIVRAHAMA